MVDEARDHETEDKKRREEAENRNRLDSLVYQTEKLVKENRERIPVADLNAVEGEIQKAKDALAKGDNDAIKKASEDLTHASHKMAEAMYQQSGPGAQTGQEPQGGNGAGDGTSRSSGTSGAHASGDVIDAEYEEQ